MAGQRRGPWRGLLAGVAALLLLGLTGTAWWAAQWYRSPGPLAAPLTMVLPSGERARAIGRQLAAAGVLTHPELFAPAERLTRSAGSLRAGEYEFPAAISPEGALALLRSGKTVVRRLVVPEGLTTPQVLALVEHAEALKGEVTAPPGEGELLPDTYFYSWGDGRQAMIDRMRRAMQRTLAGLWARRAPGLPLADPAMAATLASIVEKETAIAAERPKIAGVFYNRLRLGMRLQADSTVIYALTLGRAPLGRPLTRDDLGVGSPYNTYAVKGLPPGPIDNPGRAALASVLVPATTDALYFVANGSGGHAFAATLAQHDQNVAHWRQVEAGHR